MVNPSDCVDMSCDGHKKALLRDTDGTFLGSAGFIVPFAEYEWDEDPSHGVGDYRIPSVMQTDVDGDRLDMADVYSHTGQ